MTTRRDILIEGIMTMVTDMLDLFVELGDRKREEAAALLPHLERVYGELETLLEVMTKARDAGDEPVKARLLDITEVYDELLHEYVAKSKRLMELAKATEVNLPAEPTERGSSEQGDRYADIEAIRDAMAKPLEDVEMIDAHSDD